MNYPQPGFMPRFLSPRPSLSATPEANVVATNYQPTQDFSDAFNTMTLTDPFAGTWYMDSGATSHLASSPGILQSVFNLNTINR